MSATGTKRTSPSALHMSAFDPKRTLVTGSSLRKQTERTEIPHGSHKGIDLLFGLCAIPL
jgi:hypothetical protein